MGLTSAKSVDLYVRCNWKWFIDVIQYDWKRILFISSKSLPYLHYYLINGVYDCMLLLQLNAQGLYNFIDIYRWNVTIKTRAMNVSQKALRELLHVYTAIISNTELEQNLYLRRKWTEVEYCIGTILVFSSMRLRQTFFLHLKF